MQVRAVAEVAGAVPPAAVVCGGVGLDLDHEGRPDRDVCLRLPLVELAAPGGGQRSWQAIQQGPWQYSRRHLDELK